MARWRDETSAECQTDLDELLDAAIELAAELLSENPGLDPVAIVNRLDTGRTVVAVAQSDADQYAASETPMRDRLTDALRSESHQLRSVAIVSEVEVAGESGSQLEVLLEHREYAMQVLVPYSMPDSATFNLGTMRAAVSPHLVWQ
ncbi:hypothetical protein GOSPT_065_00030 [Gordonia sputi NBRC 100414]|uniref:Uncharacterized protein n=1 Tax=Gordonia sputi NBRC 100414 TaxID=1089453 RepID=H5U0X9_9ACTN|nr:hypothetical protein GOSPT_065_00030 [Gordonia sputi NBRC 100414]